MEKSDAKRDVKTNRKLRGEETLKLLTPFYSKHVEYGATFVDFDGWPFPLKYKPIEEEINMVRERAGFIDFSANSLLAVVGKDAFTFMQKMLVNDLRRISPGKMIYSSMMDETGAIVADTTVLWLEENYFFINGGVFDKQKFMGLLKQNASGLEAYIVDTGACFLAFQGPKTKEILQKAMNVKDMPFFGVKRDNLGDIPVLVGCAGFTGELGYEFYVHSSHAIPLWETLVELGKEYEVGPFGIDATTVMAVEKGYLIGPDFYEGGTPLEWGLGWTVAFDKDFSGKEVLQKRKSEGIKTKLVGFEISDPRVVPDTGDRLLKGGDGVGEVTIATYGNTVGKNIGRGWVNIAYADAGEELEVEHANKRTKVIVSKSYRWYDPENKLLK
ncbi:MAG: aminomethyltransferase family protein [Pseudomonadota bacterium]